MEQHAKKQEMKERKRIALEICNLYKGNPEYTQYDITDIVQKTLDLPRHVASKLVLSLNIFPKRQFLKFTPSGNPNTMICPKCNTEKENSMFPLKGKNRYGNPRYSYCKDCTNNYQKALHIKKQFNLSTEEHEKLGEICHICGRSKLTNSLSVDHDHKTGLIRGKLCMRCNRGVAWFQDNPELFDLAADYLRHPPAPDILGKEIFGRTGRVSKRRGKKKAYVPKNYYK